MVMLSGILLGLVGFRGVGGVTKVIGVHVMSK